MYHGKQELQVHAMLSIILGLVSSMFKSCYGLTISAPTMFGVVQPALHECKKYSSPLTTEEIYHLQ